jgi:hypothetical protein
MKIALHTFSPVVQQKSVILRKALRSLNTEILPWRDRAQADGCVIYNIHNSVYSAIHQATKLKKPLVSLQEGMFAIGWPGTWPGMRAECQKANIHKIKQLVWSRFEQQNYITMGRKPEFVDHFGNPEHDLLLREPKITRAIYDIPEDAFLIVHIDQYAHRSGGPSKEHIDLMSAHIEKTVDFAKHVWCIRCLHPIHSKQKQETVTGRLIVRPFHYPIFDFLRMADLVITLSSTEGITSAILDVPIIQYDLSGSKERWPFTQHGVAIRATTCSKLVELTKLAMEHKLPLRPTVNYKHEYQVDGKSAERVAQSIVRYFNANC